MFGVGKDLCGSSSPTSPAEAGLLRASCTGPCPGGSWISPQPPWAICSSALSPSEEVLPHVQLDLPLLHFVPVAPCPVAGHHWKESGPVLLTPTLQIFRGIDKNEHCLVRAGSRSDSAEPREAALPAPSPTRGTPFEGSPQTALLSACGAHMDPVHQIFSRI